MTVDIGYVPLKRRHIKIMSSRKKLWDEWYKLMIKAPTEERRPIGEDEGDPKVDGKGFRERFWEEQIRNRERLNLNQQMFNIPNLNITSSINPYNSYNRDRQHGYSIMDRPTILNNFNEQVARWGRTYVPPIIEKKEEEIKIISLNTQRKMRA